MKQQTNKQRTKTAIIDNRTISSQAILVAIYFCLVVDNESSQIATTPVEHL
jgi:hypothetical protein